MRIAFFGDSLTSGVPGSSYLAILRRKLPGHTLINQGRGNDTIASLYRRIRRMQFGAPFDVAFLWIGVNDAGRRPTWLHRAFNALLGQPRARDLDEFRAGYRATLDLLGPHTQRMIAVSPLLRGEDLDNGWNHRLALMSDAIQDLASSYEGVEFLDLRAVFAPRLAACPTSGYLSPSAAHVLLDALTLRSQAQIDGKAAARGLYFTLDGLHLNSAGAELVAETFLEALGR